MNINKDLATVDNNLLKLPSGAYLYRSSSGEFDIDAFNRDYEQYKVRRKNQMERNMALKLAEYNKPKEFRPIYKYSLGEILINTKDSLFEILDDILQKRFSPETFTKNNRLFYLGIFIIFVACFVFLYSIITSEESEKYKNTTSNIEINHIHKIL